MPVIDGIVFLSEPQSICLPELTLLVCSTKNLPAGDIRTSAVLEGIHSPLAAVRGNNAGSISRNASISPVCISSTL